MVNYKAYKILSKIAEPGLIMFQLEDYIEHEKLFHGRKIKGKGYIGCENHPPYSNYKVGDWLEIDLDRIGDKNDARTFDDTSIVRKVGSSSEIVPRGGNNSVNLPSISQNQVTTIIGQINSAINSDERNEYEAKINVDSNGKYRGFSMIGRRK